MRVFYKGCKFSFSAGESAQPRVGVACEKALCGFWAWRRAQRGLSCCLATRAVWAVPKEPEWEQRLGKSHFPQFCFHHYCSSQRQGRARSLFLGMSLCWGAAGQGMCSLLTSASRAGLSLRSSRQIELLSAWRVSPKWMVNGGEKEGTEGNQMCSDTDRSFHLPCATTLLIWISPGKCLGCLVSGKGRISLKAAAACPLVFTQECVVVLRPPQPGLQVPKEELPWEPRAGWNPELPCSWSGLCSSHSWPCYSLQRPQ